MKKNYLTLAIFFLVQIVNAQEKKDSVFKPVELPLGYTATLNKIYTTVNNWQGKLDYYLPPNLGTTTPVVINIHGGGWNHGEKESQTGFSSFFKAGFAVVNIEYRLTGVATAPAAIEDTRCALIYIINNAKALNIDVNKIVIMGGSSGGHLALMGGLLANNNLFDKNCKTTNKIKVAAIIDKYGITDVWDWAWGNDLTSKSAINWLGLKQKDSLFALSVSPIKYITKNSPPIFIIHGDADPIVPYMHSVQLYKKLLALKVKTSFFTVEGGLHGKFDKEKNTEVNKAIMLFLKNLNIY